MVDASPSIRLLFSQLSPRHRLLLLLPAIAASILSGGLAPFMTVIIGQIFNAFAQFPTTPNPPQSVKSALLHRIAIAALELLAIAVGSIALGSLTSSLWIWTGESNVMALRLKVYKAVTQKDMVWFDTKMGSEPSLDREQGPLGAGGLMSKFTRETDDVRNASSLASGMVLQYLTTCLTCLGLAFSRSWSLTLVILSAVPLLTVVQALSQSLASPLLASERTEEATAATLVDRALASIATVKAFNAAPYEQRSLDQVLVTLNSTSRKLNAVWGATSAAAQFVSMAMFVQGFWFGAKLVRDGKNSAGDVMAVFWACLIATSNLQMCIPQFITLAKGKFAVAALLSLVEESTTPTSSTAPSEYTLASPSSRSVLFPKRPFTNSLRKIMPSRTCAGEFSLHDLSFAYPSRPTLPVLSNVSLYLPANELTFIVGSSGSGKSTIAQLLLGMYQPIQGTILLDDVDMSFLDKAWARGNVCGVGQGMGDVVVEGKSILENVRLGVEGATEEMVHEACRAALLHEFVRDLDAGYETLLGSAGAGVALSGGQKQRLAIARARLRNPSVLILDEATSALDPTSRILVFEALKRWRKNKTTIVITHDLSQIESGDFVYVLKGGDVVEQGFRSDLEGGLTGEEEEEDSLNVGAFREMMEIQQRTGGFLPEKSPLEPGFLPSADDHALVGNDDDEEEQDEDEDPEPMFNVTVNMKHQSLARPAMRPLTLGNWMFDVVADLTSATTTKAAVAVPTLSVAGAGAGGAGGGGRAGRDLTRRVSRFVPIAVEAFTGSIGERERKRRPSSIQVLPCSSSSSPSAAGSGGMMTPGVVVPPEAYTVASRRFSLQFTPTSPTFGGWSWREGSTSAGAGVASECDDDDEEEEEMYESEKKVVEMSGSRAVGNRGGKMVVRKRWDEEKMVPLVSVKVDSKKVVASTEQQDSPIDRPSFWAVVREVFPTIPYKPLLFLGLFTCLASGAVTPVFSFLLSRLQVEVSMGAKDVSTINFFGGLVLGITALDGLLMGLKYFIMETSGNAWVFQIRKRAFSNVLLQDKKWFDRDDNAGVKIVQTLVKDGDDARNLVSVVMGQGCVVFSMLCVGLLWAMVKGWQLTLAGMAMAPVFAGVMALQAALVGRCEIRNKRAREEVAKGYYDAIVNVKGIRAMAYEGVFERQFEIATDKALSIGVRGAFVEGCTHGVASGLIYAAEAVLFYVGAVLVARGTYTFPQMTQVLNLVLFTVSIGSQLMAFTQRIAKSVQATNDFNRLLKLDTNTDESRGIMRPELSGGIRFNHVGFSYPERKDATVLRDIDLHIAQGECIAIVGPSGSGKSTITSLLQRLYEPDSGTITIGGTDLSSIDVRHLRHHISVVSQNPNLFDTTIAENIRYGDDTVSDVDIRKAAKAANVHEFVMSLPQGYDTMLGENAGLVSGGQAQRLQIARALVRPAKVLVLDECTSALDLENQAAVLETVRGAKVGRTTVMVTHKVPVMMMCDRIVLVSEGVVREQGSYEELMERKGLFATLARGGEWIGE